MNQKASANESIALRFYKRMQRWADAGWANSVVFAWGLLQASFVPGLAELFFLPLALAKPRNAYRLAAFSAAGTILGSVALYWTGALALAEISGAMSSWLGIGPGSMERMHAILDQYGWLAVLASIFTPLSTKLTSVASGAFDVPFAAFLVALTAGRLTRVFLIAYLVQHGGAEKLAKWLKVPT